MRFDAVSVEQTGTPLDSVDNISLFQKKLRKIGSVLPGNPGDQRDFLIF